MSAVSIATRFAKAAIKAPVRALKKMRDNPITTGLAFLATDIASKVSVRILANSLVHLNDYSWFYSSSSTQLLFGLGAASLAYLFAKTNSNNVKLGTALALSCAAGNLGEASLHGSVTDFIKIGSWPVFNIADASGTLGGLTLLYDCFSRGHAANERPVFSLEAWKGRGKTVASSLFSRNLWNTIQQTYFYGMVTKLLFGDFFIWPILISLSLIRDLRHAGEKRMFQ